MKIFNWFFIVCFILFAAVQYNDPDPYIWMPIYLYAAYLCWQSIKGNFKPLLYVIGYVVYSAYATYKFVEPDGVIDWFTKHDAGSITETMKANHQWVEETREFFGLVILIVVLAINHIYLARKKKTA